MSLAVAMVLGWWQLNDEEYTLTLIINYEYAGISIGVGGGV